MPYPKYRLYYGKCYPNSCSKFEIKSCQYPTAYPTLTEDHYFDKADRTQEYITKPYYYMLSSPEAYIEIESDEYGGYDKFTEFIGYEDTGSPYYAYSSSPGILRIQILGTPPGIASHKAKVVLNAINGPSSNPTFEVGNDESVIGGSSINSYYFCIDFDTVIALEDYDFSWEVYAGWFQGTGG